MSLEDSVEPYPELINAACIREITADILAALKSRRYQDARDLFELLIEKAKKTNHLTDYELFNTRKALGDAAPLIGTNESTAIYISNGIRALMKDYIGRLKRRENRSL